MTIIIAKVLLVASTAAWGVLAHFGFKIGDYGNAGSAVIFALACGLTAAFL